MSPSDGVSIVFELPHDTARVVIGPKGTHRMALERVTKSKIEVLSGDSPSVGHCKVTTRNQVRAEKAKQTILDFIEDARIQTALRSNLPLPDDVLVEHLPIEDALVGNLIGKHGVRLLELMIRAGCRLSVSRSTYDDDDNLHQISVYARGKERMDKALMHVKTQIKCIGSGEVTAQLRMKRYRSEPKLDPISVNFTYRREIHNPELANALILVKSYIPYICKDSDAHIVLFSVNDKIIITGKDEETVDEGLNILTNLDSLPCRNIDCDNFVSYPYSEEDGEEGYCKECAPTFLDPEFIKARQDAFQKMVEKRRANRRRAKATRDAEGESEEDNGDELSEEEE